MQPFSRETITDRRQSYVRWTAVAAGSLVALGTWLLLQLLFTGGALSAIDPDEVDNIRAFGIGTSIGSVLAPLLAMFAGGLVAGRLADHFDRKVSGFHGALVWAITAVLGVTLLANVAGKLAADHAFAAHGDMGAPPPGANEFVEGSVDEVNAKLKAQNAPAIDKDELIDAARFSMAARHTFDRDRFIARLDDKTSLSRPEAEAALEALGGGAGDVMMAANQLGQHRERALDAAEDAGNALLAAGFGLLLCLLAAVGGGVLGAHLMRRRGRVDRDARDVRDTDVRPGHITAQYPPVTPDSVDPRDPRDRY